MPFGVNHHEEEERQANCDGYVQNHPKDKEQLVISLDGWLLGNVNRPSSPTYASQCEQDK
jgi:hypothetical protein